MSDENSNAEAAPTATDEKQFAIQKIYVKDVSFEAPNSPKVFTQEWRPNVDLNLNTDVERLDASVFEVTLRATVTTKVEEVTAFLAEVQQSGIFSISGFGEEELGHMVGSFCPNILFPYLRETVSDLVTRGGFPQLLLSPVNFEALYAQQLAQKAQQASH